MASILKVGIPTFIMQSVTSFVGIVMNSVLLGYSSTAVAVYGICIKIQNLATIGVHGMNCALIPIVAYNFGAKNKERIKEAVRWTIIFSVVIMLLILLVLELFPKYVLLLLDASENMLAIGSAAIRIITISWFLSIYSVVVSTALQALGMANYSMYITLLRQAVLLLPLVFLMARFGALGGIWLAFCMAELLVIPLTYLLYKKAEKQIIRTL